jgi:hypothetical protein
VNAAAEFVAVALVYRLALRVMNPTSAVWAWLARSDREVEPGERVAESLPAAS